MDRTSEFSDKAIKALKHSTTRVSYFDTKSPLCIRVGNRSKVWFMRYQLNGKRKQLTLGKYPDLSLSKARKLANDKTIDIANGIDPAGVKQERKTAPTVSDLWEMYQDSLERRAKPKSANTIRQETSFWNRIIEPSIGARKIQDIKPVDLADMLHSYAKKAPVGANRLHALLSVLFKPALEKGIITIHPLQWISKPSGSEKPRKRVLSDKEIKTIWPKLDTLRRNPRDQIKLGLLTAQRPGEIASMKWSDINFDKGIWRQEDTKTSGTHLTPLPRQALDILRYRNDNPGRRYKANPSDYVFPTAHNTPTGSEIRAAESPIKACKKIGKDTGINGWTPHDLRRTARTLLSRLEIQHHVRERILNHSLGKVEAVYDQYDYLPEKRDALQKLADEIYQMMED